MWSYSYELILNCKRNSKWYSLLNSFFYILFENFSSIDQFVCRTFAVRHCWSLLLVGQSRTELLSPLSAWQSSKTQIVNEPLTCPSQQTQIWRIKYNLKKNAMYPRNYMSQRSDLITLFHLLSEALIFVPYIVDFISCKIRHHTLILLAFQNTIRKREKLYFDTNCIWTLYLFLAIYFASWNA